MILDGMTHKNTQERPSPGVWMEKEESGKQRGSVSNAELMSQTLGFGDRTGGAAAGLTTGQMCSTTSVSPSL